MRQFWGQVEFPLWNSTCFARPGSSGSPILISDGNGGWRVAAILTMGYGGGSIRNELLEGAHPKGWPWRVQHMQLGNPVSGFLDRVRPFLKDDKGARMIGAGTNKPYGEKDETLVAELEKQRVKRPEDMALAARWLIALHNARGAEAALTEIDKLLALYPESRELHSVRIDIVDEDDLGYSTAWRKAVDDMAVWRKQFPEMNELQTVQGYLLARGGECKNSANLLRKSWDRLGSSPDIRMAWADAMACAGEHRAALAAYDEMLKYIEKYEHRAVHARDRALPHRPVRAGARGPAQDHEGGSEGDLGADDARRVRAERRPSLRGGREGPAQGDGGDRRQSEPGDRARRRSAGPGQGRAGDRGAEDRAQEQEGRHLVRHDAGGRAEQDRQDRGSQGRGQGPDPGRTTTRAAGRSSW